jgi:hypothetical protein
MPSPSDSRFASSPAVAPRTESLAWALRAFGLRAFGFWLVGGTVLALVGYRARAPQPVPELAFPWLNLWYRWDAKWYLTIAADGYTYAPGEQGPVAFFPFYPLLVRAVSWLGPPVPLAGTFVSLGCGVLATWLFAAWARHFVSHEDARAAHALLFGWPFAFFLMGTAYSDSTFLCLVIGAFLLLERGRWGWATVVAAFATAARPVGPALVLGLWVRQLELLRVEGARPWDWRGFFPWLGLSGLGAWMLFLHARFGDALAFAHIQAAWGQLSGWDSLLKYPALLRLRWWDWSLPLFDGALALLLISTAWPLRKRLGWGYAVFTAVVLGVPLITSRELTGLGRYGLAAFPAFLELALRRQGWPRLWRTWLVFAGVLGLVLASVFAVGRFVS